MPANEQFRVVIRSLQPDTLSNEQKMIIATATHFFESTFRSEYFRNRVLNFGGSKKGFTYAYNRTNEEMYERLIRAKEANGDVDLFTADLYLKFIPGNSPDGKEIGYVSPGSRTINIYSEFLTSMNVGRLAAHFAHEWTHVLGYTHPVYSEANLEVIGKTIPYAIQHIVTDYAQQRMQDFMLDHTGRK